MAQCQTQRLMLGSGHAGYIICSSVGLTHFGPDSLKTRSRKNELVKNEDGEILFTILNQSIVWREYKIRACKLIIFAAIVIGQVMTSNGERAAGSDSESLVMNPKVLRNSDFDFMHRWRLKT